MLLNSFYEYCDLKMLFMQIFGGYERWIYPQFFSTFIILPEEFVNYEYENEYTGEKYTLDWEANGAYEKLVRTIAKNELVIPCNIKPIYKLTAFSDASQRYGSAADLPEWKLGATIRYEIEIPSFLTLHTDYKINHSFINITAGSAYSEYNYTQVPANIVKYDIHLGGGSGGGTDATCNQEFVGEYEFSTRYYHIVSQDEYDSTSDLIITLTEEVTDIHSVIINTKTGKLNYGDQYYFSPDGFSLILKKEEVRYEVGWVIEIYFYKKVG
jgi:hypothetical protein